VGARFLHLACQGGGRFALLSPSVTPLPMMYFFKRKNIKSNLWLSKNLWQNSVKDLNSLKLQFDFQIHFCKEICCIVLHGYKHTRKDAFSKRKKQSNLLFSNVANICFLLLLSQYHVINKLK